MPITQPINEFPFISPGNSCAAVVFLSACPVRDYADSIIPFGKDLHHLCVGGNEAGARWRHVGWDGKSYL
jgi:hypothetical protein